jgi:anti-sigma regulatory factor (Ser/Thr protein kinase)
MTATSGSPEQGASQSQNAPAPSAGKRWRRVFPGEARQLSLVRRWLESLLPDCPARDNVLCIATELGTNAIRHTASGRGGRFALEVVRQRSAVRVAVEDGGAVGAPQVIDDPAGEQGRGLLVVQGLSVRFGVLGDHRGRTVWAEVPWGDADATASASPQDPYAAAIRDGLAGLAIRFADIPTWFGRSTLQWWGLAHGRLVAAPSAQELASLLGGLMNSPSPEDQPDSRDWGTARVCRDRKRRHSWLGRVAMSDGCGPVPGRVGSRFWLAACSPPHRRKGHGDGQRGRAVAASSWALLTIAGVWSGMTSSSVSRRLA